MDFLKLYSLILEASFADLPDSAPYGFWIYPDGDFAIVKRIMGHGYIAIEIINKNPQLKAEFYRHHKLDDPDLDGQAHEFLLGRGYNRVAISNGFLYFSKMLDNITNRQKQTIKDIAAFYDITPDKGKHYL